MAEQIKGKSEIVLDNNGTVDWQANDWPEPNPICEGDTDTMPEALYDEWLNICGYCGDAITLGV